jgi:hypothetical protein
MGAHTRALVIACAAVFALSCGRGRTDAPSVGTPRFDLADVTAAHGEFLAAKRALADIEARGATADGAALRAARARFDAAYERDQKVLAVFLTLAVNQRPEASQTHDALRLYAESAVAAARVLIDRGGDAARAVAVLEGAERPFRALGLAVPPGLAAALEQARRQQAGRPRGGRIGPETRSPGGD